MDMCVVKNVLNCTYTVQLYLSFLQNQMSQTFVKILNIGVSAENETAVCQLDTA